MYKLFIIILLTIINLAGRGQALYIDAYNKTDSLKELLPVAGEYEQVDLLNRIAAIYAPVNFDSSISYSARSMRLATIQQYDYGIGCSRLNTGNAYYYRQDFKNALIAYLSALKILEGNKIWKELAEVSAMLGNINFFIMRYKDAISYYRQALDYSRKAVNDESMTEVFYAMSLTFWKDGMKDSTSFYCDKLMKYSEKHDDPSIAVLALTLNGQLYEDERAMVYYKEALKTSIQLNDYKSIAIIYNNMASLYDRSSSLFEIYGDLKLSRSYYDTALAIALKADYSILQAMIPASLAEIDIEEGKYKLAGEHLSLSEAKLNSFYKHPDKTSSPLLYFSMGKIYDHYLMLQTKNYLYNNQYKLALANGEFMNAIEFLNKYYQSKDTLNSAQQGRQLELILAEAEAERTDLKLHSLAQENELSRLRLIRNRFVFAGIAAVVLIISLFLLLFFQRKRLLAEQKSVSMEQRLLRAQMNPHFLFNSLASIQNYIINEDTDNASIYLARFSQLVRNILDNSTEEYMPLDKEIETIRNYLELQKVRYAGKFDFNIDIDTDIDIESVLVPPMLAQPFIENAIEHGIKHKSTPGRIDIRFRYEHDLIRFEVEDDGVGREKAREIEAAKGTRHRSMATSITTDRLASLNKKLKMKIRMEIEDLKDEEGVGVGTRVRFGIPIVSVEC